MKDFLFLKFLDRIKGLFTHFGIDYPKQKIRWTSSYSHVKKRDTKAFTRLVGQSTIGSGISIALLGIFMILNQMWISFITFGICIAISMTIYFIAQHKYNGY